MYHFYPGFFLGISMTFTEMAARASTCMAGRDPGLSSLAPSSASGTILPMIGPLANAAGGMVGAVEP